MAAALLALSSVLLVVKAIPSEPYFFDDQLVDHFSASTAKFSQRYYKVDKYFGGPGSPIFCILGGESAIDPSTGIFYPYIVELAQVYNALVIEPEHRFYGESQPLSVWSSKTLELLTPQQALADAATFILSVQREHGCSGEKGTPRCPVLTVGGSYPGWLSAMMRLRYPALVDFAYAASAPVLFYAQEVNQSAYYEIVTRSAYRASPSCPSAVQSMLRETLGAVGITKATITKQLGLCQPLPAYLAAGGADGPAKPLVDAISMIVMYTFASLNMENYPPPKTSLLSACQAIEAGMAAAQPWRTLLSFLNGYSDQMVAPLPPNATAAASAAAPPTAARRRRRAPLRALSLQEFEAAGQRSSPDACYNLQAQLPAGANATISSGDWSGVGVGTSGANWDFETCTFCVEAIGTNGITDMFLPRPWSLAWLQQHCASRFAVQPQPTALVEAWGFNALQRVNTSRIIFTNGLNDGWSAGGVMTPLPEQQIHVFNMPDGAHHSDLSHSAPGPDDTPGVKRVHSSVKTLLGQWLAQVKKQQPSNNGDTGSSE